MTERYFLDRDDSGHWYLVPAERRKEWVAWVCMDEEDPVSSIVPAYARRLNVSPSRVTFAGPIEER